MKILNTHTHCLFFFLSLSLFLFISLFQGILCIIICYQYRYTFNNDLNIQILRKYLKLEYLKIEFESELVKSRATNEMIGLMEKKEIVSKGEHFC